jgi:hypothetical protein
VLSSPPADENEPNDTEFQAPWIYNSGTISGAIGIIGDVDIFRFQGRAGDRISVICDTQETGSYLDSILEIYNGSYELVAWNDQNGLAPELYPINDSFTQLVLPADDIYYILVADYYDDGGDGYTYTLHIMLP